MKIKKTTIIISLIILNIIILNTTIMAMPDSEIDRVTQQIQPRITNYEPTLTEIETTVYYSPTCEDFESWCSPEKGSCFETTTQILEFYPDNQNIQNCVKNRAGGWCCIPESHRGIYEEIKCQGSGVCESCEGDICVPEVYSYSNIQPTQQDSIPISGDFERGRTRIETDPKEKWTVAVNTDPTTDCYIPDGTVMYIDFGPGHAWSGLYRAEDTGSAFEGECKMDIYAGVGEEKEAQARREVSGRRPEIYLLEPKQPAPSILSTIKLADEYEFISREDYLDEIIAAQPETQIDLRPGQGGVIVLPYSFGISLNAIKHFYDSIQSFSDEVLRSCSNLKYEQRAACAYKKAREYEEKGIKITNCARSQIPLNKKDIQENQKLNISGIIKEIKKTTEQINLTIQQIHGEKLNLTLKLPQQYHSHIRDEVGAYIELKNMTIKQQNPLILKYEETTPVLAAEIFMVIPSLSREWPKEKNMQTIALKAADCQTTQDCICKIDLIETNQEYELLGRTINKNEKTLTTNIIFQPQDTTITNRIAPKNDEPLVLAPNLLTPPWAQEQEESAIIPANEIKAEFKKGITNTLILIEENYEEHLEKCEPANKHAIFCAKPIKTHEAFKNNPLIPDNMNFSLKI